MPTVMQLFPVKPGGRGGRGRSGQQAARTKTQDACSFWKLHQLRLQDLVRLSLLQAISTEATGLSKAGTTPGKLTLQQTPGQGLLGRRHCFQSL